jgi:transposase
VAALARGPARRAAGSWAAGDERRRDRRLARQGPERGAHTGPSPVGRGRPGSKKHLIVDRHGTPLAVTLTGGNRHDVTQLLPLLDAVPPIRGLRGRPRRRPRRLFADRGYDYDKYRRILRRRGITPKIARRGVAHGSGLGKTAGSSNGPSPGSTSSSAYGSATRYTPTSTSDYSNSPATSSAYASSEPHSETIN